MTQRQFDELQYLAERIEEGDNFEADLNMYIRLSRTLEQDLYDQVYDAQVLRVLSQLPAVQAPEKKRTFWNTVMPKSTYGMYDRYRHKETMREQVRASAATFRRIQRMLEDELI